MTSRRAVPEGPLVRVRFTVAYHGARFHGFTENRDVRTVAGCLRPAFEKVLGHPVELVCAGRTDRGVHARGQVISIGTRHPKLDVDRLTTSVNKLCRPDVSLRDPAIVDVQFDARHAAHWRRYRYLLSEAGWADPMVENRVWRVGPGLDLRAMRLATDVFLGVHDFTSFCRVPKDRPDADMTRRLYDATWYHLDDDLLCFDVAGGAFCHQMVRSIVGTLVAVGFGRMRAGDLRGVFDARDRRATADPAPPDGLTLWEVGYEPWTPRNRSR